MDSYKKRIQEKRKYLSKFTNEELIMYTLARLIQGETYKDFCSDSALWRQTYIQ